MKLSIIVPVYNVSGFIETCIQSIIWQSFDGKIECLLIDDCGSDNSMAVAESFIGKYTGPIEFRILHHDCNKGLSAARNTGILSATGEYVLFLDSDDELAPDCIEKLSSPLKDENFDFVFANYEARCSWSDMNLNLAIPEGAMRDSKRIADTYHWGWYATAWNKLVRRNFIIENHLFFEPGLLHEDELWSFKLACKANSMYAVNARTYIYNIRGTGSTITSDGKSNRHLDAYNIVWQKMTDEILSANLISNGNLISVIEDMKCNCIGWDFRLHSFSHAFSLYKFCRNRRCIDMREVKFDSISQKQKMRYAHNYMPTFLGFIYLIAIQFASACIIDLRHRKQLF